jgi:hypothetical protein
VPWLEKSSSLYAIVRDGHCLIDDFLDQLEQHDERHAVHLAHFLDMITNEPYIRPGFLREELPQQGVYAMYSERTARIPYNPSRLMCGYVGVGCRILLVGGGFIKRTSGPLQRHAEGMREALFVARVLREIHTRIDHGEIDITGPSLIPVKSDALYIGM